MVIHESQVTVCMAEPALHEIFDHEATLLAEHLRPRRVMLNMDEVRMGGACQACQERNMPNCWASVLLNKPKPSAVIFPTRRS